MFYTPKTRVGRAVNIVEIVSVVWLVLAVLLLVIKCT